MNSNDSNGPRHGRGGRRPSHRQRRPARQNDRAASRRSERENRPAKAKSEAPAKKLSFWGKILAFFTGGTRDASSPARPSRRDGRTTEVRESKHGQHRKGLSTHRAAPPEQVAVTTPRLYVGNLSYRATESDLHELFNGVGKVQNAEIATQKGTDRSKGFGFVTMLTVDEARRAVEELHDKPFMGRKLVVSGSKSTGERESS